MRVLIAGYGWLGSALGAQLAAAGHTVVGVRRDTRALEALRAPGFEPLALDLTVAGAAARLPGDLDVIVACQATDGPSAADYRAAYLDATAPLLAAARVGRGARLVLVSSTRVFGRGDGGWVDERTAVEPADEPGEVLAEAERRVLALAADGVAGAAVLRLSGLYGPGRYGVVERVRTGRLALGPGDDAWTNWCHQADAVRALEALVGRAQPGGVYHASDAEPLRRRDVVAWIARRLGLEPAVIAAPPATGPLPPRGANRRVSAVATRERLGLALVHPSLREGLAEVLP